MSYIKQLVLNNESYSQSLMLSVRDGLNRGDFKPLMSHLPQALAQVFVADPERIGEFVKQLQQLALYPRSFWGGVLHGIMSEIIKSTPMGDVAFFNSENFPWVEAAESHYLTVIKEIAPALQMSANIPAFQEIQEEQQVLTNDDKWKVIVLQGYGEKAQQNIDLFPETMALLNNIPGWTTAMYSILAPGKRIPPHEGPYNGVLRYHMGIKVPDNCGICVKNEERKWEAGKSLIFDDSFTHYAWNESDTTRVVLFVDFLRPLPFPLNVLNEWLVVDLFKETDFVKKAVKNYGKYQQFQKEFGAYVDQAVADTNASQGRK